MTLLWYIFERVYNVSNNTWGKNTFGPGQLLYAVVNGPKNWVLYIDIKR